MESLKQFLSTCKRRFIELSVHGAEVEQVHIVMGNESVDLDSAVSSITLAFLLSETSTTRNTLYFPLMPLPAEDWRLKTEITYLFTRLGISSDDLVFEDAKTKLLQLPNNKIVFTLVDHNVPSGDWKKFANNVRQIIDHHEDFTECSGVYSPETLNQLSKEIVVVGSTCTLVAERYLERAPHLLDPQLASLLLAPILVDTYNLNKDAKRATPRDIAVVDKLSSIPGLDPTVKDLSSYHDALVKAKSDVSSLTSAELLRKDYKEWTLGSHKYGISAALIPLRTWIARDPSFLEELQKFAQTRNLLFLCVMTAFTDPQTNKFHRELLIITSDDNLLNLLTNSLTTPLELVEFNKDEIGLTGKSDIYWRAWNQLAHTQSRKQVQPLIQRALQAKY